MGNFEQLGLSKDLLSVVNDLGFKEPSPIQDAVIPLLLDNSIDIVGQAATGSGKTAAFGLPLVDLLDKSDSKLRAVVLLPTRELAVQVASQLTIFTKNHNLTVGTVYGGQRFEKELAMIKNGIDILVATPGRIIDHIKRGRVDLSNIKYFILDEFDEMLKMGFVDDVDFILSKCVNRERSLFFSATISKPIQNMIKKYMPEHKYIHIKSENNVVSTIKQYYYNIKDSSKFDLLYRLLLTNPDFYGIIFVKTKSKVDELSQVLAEKGIYSQVIHGDIQQNQREKALHKFKKGHNKILIATDVAARGIDIQDLTFVVNYDLPDGIQEYMHRIGRTGRAGKEGTAITFVGKRDIRNFIRIFDHVGKTIELGQVPTKKDIIGSFLVNLEGQIKSFADKQEVHKEYLSIITALTEKFDTDVLLSYFMKDILGVMNVGEDNIHNFEIDRSKQYSSGGGNSRRRPRGGSRNGKNNSRFGGNSGNSFNRSSSRRTSSKSNSSTRSNSSYQKKSIGRLNKSKENRR